MFFRPIPSYIPSATARRVALDGFDELVARIDELMVAGELAKTDPYNVAASHWATCHGHVGLEISRVGPADIDWESTFLSSLDALRLSLC
jgi:hypothetical protein